MNQSARSRAILNGSPLPTLIKLAIPIFLGNLFQQLYNIVDAMAVGRFLGDLPLAGISAASPIIDITNALVVGSTVGIGVYFALLCGGKRYEEIKLAHSTSLIGGCSLVLLLALAGALFSRSILLAQGNAPEVCSEAMKYLLVILAGLIFAYLNNYYAAVLRSLGDSKTPFYVLLITSCLHAGLDVLLLGVFRMGIQGVAFSTIFCQFFASVWMILYTYRKEPSLALSRAEFRFQGKVGLILLSYAWAAALQQAVVSVGRLLVQGTLTDLGTASVTGYNMGMRVETFLWTLPQGITAAMVICVSQNLGQGNTKRIRTFYYLSLGFSFLFGITIGALCLLKAPLLLSAFTKRPEIIEAGATYTHFMGYAYIFGYVGDAIQSLFRGLGRLKLTMLASAGQVILRVILSFLLVPRLGIPGICLSVITGWALLVVIEGLYSLKVAKNL